MKSDKALSNAALELTQKIQMHFPRDIDPTIVQAWNGCLKEKLTEQLSLLFGKMPEADTLLRILGVLTMPVTFETWNASLEFNKHTKVVQITDVGDNFKEWFSGKTEESLSELNICFYELRKNSLDRPIIEELGGEQEVETTLAEIFALMRIQRNGWEGILLVNGSTNTFYVRDKSGLLRTVLVHWYNGGWNIYALCIGDQYERSRGARVFSRYST